MDTIVFDIGGTWFRSGILTPQNTLKEVSKQPAINYKNNPEKAIHQLQAALIDYLLETVSRLKAANPNKEAGLVGVSLGAALNAHTGFVLNSGPLWGPTCLPFDLLSALRERESRVRWVVVNDITAALMRHLSDPEYRAFSRVMLLTVSTGIGCRIYDTRLRSVPVDRVHGLQGEIGHLPVHFMYGREHIELACDCGGANHINAFCSGRGIEVLIRRLATICKEEISGSALSEVGSSESGGRIFQLFAGALSQGDLFALRILDAVTRPVANVLLNALTIDPQIEVIILTGGVISALSDQYLNSLVKNLHDLGMYQVTSSDPDYFSRRIRMNIADDHSGLIGAGLYAKAQAGSLSSHDRAID
jgi:2-epi-5-epi-valiolone 7-kinase